MGADVAFVNLDTRQQMWSLTYNEICASPVDGKAVLRYFVQQEARLMSLEEGCLKFPSSEATPESPHTLRTAS